MENWKCCFHTLAFSTRFFRGRFQVSGIMKVRRKSSSLKKYQKIRLPVLKGLVSRWIFVWRTIKLNQYFLDMGTGFFQIFILPCSREKLYKVLFASLKTIIYKKKNSRSCIGFPFCYWSIFSNVHLSLDAENVLGGSL